MDNGQDIRRRAFNVEPPARTTQKGEQRFHG
jgi:hypothetical protein